MLRFRVFGFLMLTTMMLGIASSQGQGPPGPPVVTEIKVPSGDPRSRQTGAMIWVLDGTSTVFIGANDTYTTYAVNFNSTAAALKSGTAPVKSGTGGTFEHSLAVNAKNKYFMECQLEYVDGSTKLSAFVNNPKPYPSVSN